MSTMSRNFFLLFKTFLFKKVPLSFAIASLVPGSLVFAQDSGNKSAVIEEIVITATKRSESLQDVPISISALNAQSIERIGAAKLDDLQYSAPNLVFISPDAGAQIGIRGVADGSRNMGSEQRVGVYVDGIYSGRADSVNQDLLDIERVEVLRGPQGTLFGKDTIAGAINIVTRAPNETLGGKVAVGYGNYNDRKIRAALDVPLVEDKLFSSFSLVDHQHDGYVKNTFPGQPDYGDQNYTNGRAKLRAILSDTTEATLALDYSIQDYSGYAPEQNGITKPDNAPGSNIGNLSQVPHNDREIKSISIDIDHGFANGFEFRSLTSYRESEVEFSEDNGVSEFDMIDILNYDEETQASQEIRISTPSDYKFNYIAGLYFFYQKSSTLRQAVTKKDFFFSGLELEQSGNVETNSYAAFFNGKYEITDNLRAMVGARYTLEEKDILYNQDGVPFFIDIDGFKDDYSEAVLSPSVGLSYTTTNGNLLYATVSQGYKGGGWNADYVTTADIGFDPEFATSYEIGAKMQWLDNRLRLNAALFRTEFEDFQVFSVRLIPTGGLLFTLTNAGEAISEGVELELSAVPIEGLSVSASLGYADSVYKEYKNGGGLGVHYDGNRTPYAPKLTSNLNAEYRFSLTDGVNAYVNVDYSYRSDYYTDTANTEPAFHIDSHDLVNARLGLLFLGDALEATIWAKNLADAEYEFRKVISFVGTSVSQYGPPRTYGIEFKYAF